MKMMRLLIHLCHKCCKIHLIVVYCQLMVILHVCIKNVNIFYNFIHVKCSLDILKKNEISGYLGYFGI